MTARRTHGREGRSAALLLLAAAVAAGCGNSTTVPGGGGSESASRSVQARRYVSNGTPTPLDPFQVNTYTTSAQRSPAVAVNQDGTFVVVWESDGSPEGDNTLLSIQGRVYLSNGSPLGDQFQVNTATTLSERAPVVGSDRNGNFVVAWYRYGPEGDIRARRFNSVGIPVFTMGTIDDFAVSTNPTGNKVYPDVAVDADGDFVIVWHRQEIAGDANVYGRAFDSGGRALGVEFQVNDYTTGIQGFASVGIDELGPQSFTVSWASVGSPGDDADGESVQARRFLFTSTGGNPASGQFQVNGYTTGNQRAPTVSTNGASGASLVAWESSTYPGDDASRSVVARGFLTDGTDTVAEFLVNRTTDGDQIDPDVAFEPGGMGTNNFVITWTSAVAPSTGTDDSLSSVVANRFQFDGTRLFDPEFQVNTYTFDYQYLPRVGVNQRGDFVVVWTSYGSDGTDN